MRVLCTLTIAVALTAAPVLAQGSEAPKAEAPKAEAPAPEAPTPDAPKPDAPKPDAPKPDAPKPDAPKPDAPKPDAPKPDAPKRDAPPAAPASVPAPSPPVAAAAPVEPVVVAPKALIPRDAVAGWTGPSVIVDAPTGAGAGEIGIGRGDVAAYDETPRPLLVADDGTLVLCDRVNRRIVVLRADGSVRNTFGPQQLSSAEAQGWLRGEAILFGTSIVTKTGDVLQRYALDGTLLATARKVAGSIAGLTLGGNIVLRESGPLFRLFDASLAPQTTQATEPSLLGAFTTRTLSRIVRDPTSGDSTIAQDVELIARGRTTTLIGLDSGVLDVVIGRDGSIFVTSEATDSSRNIVREYPDGTQLTLSLPHVVVYEHAPSGQRVASVALPPTEFPPFERLVAGGNFESEPTVVVADVTVDLGGNVYVYSYDAARFRILKWTHQ